MGAPGSARRVRSLALHLLYNLALLVAGAALFPIYLVRSLGNPEILRHLGERFGGTGAVRFTPPQGLWVHAASVGEAQVAGVLLDRLQERHPDRPLLLSVTTPTGRKVARRSAPGGVEGPFFFPLDFSFAARRALRRRRPAVFVAVETEIWPMFLRQCRRLGIPYGIANGRISPRSYGRYRWIRPLLKPALAGAAFVCAQSRADADRFLALGARADRIRVTGNLKYDVRPDTAALERLRALLHPAPAGPLVIAGSTRSGEERLVLRAFRVVRGRLPTARLILAPRHPERFDEVEALIRAEGFGCLRRSRLRTAASDGPQVVLLDSVGELGHLYGLAACAYVGGSLVPRGGHNPLEPAAWGVPVLFGPHMENFELIATDLLEAGAAVRVADESELAAGLLRLLEGEDEHRRAAAAARDCAGRHRGAVEETVNTIDGVFDRAAPRAPDPAGASAGPFRRLTATLLAPASWLYGGLIALRNRRFDRGGGRIARAGIPVISIGNLAVGGTGKTPVTLELARRLRADGWAPAIVSRGYRRRGRASRLQTVHSGPGEPLADARRFGDEPTLMARRLDGVPVVVCSDRHRAIDHARDRLGTDIALLDDGFQHRRLHRDVDLLLIDALNPFGNGRLLPAGPLREPLREIRRASAVLLTRSDLAPGDAGLADTVRRWAGAGTPVFRFRQRCVGLSGPVEGSRTEPGRLGGVPVLAFAGIGNPGSFAAELRRSGLRVVGSIWFRDHHPYSSSDRDRILRVAARVGAEVLLTTEKDRIRFPVEGCPLPLYALEITLEPIEEAEFLQFLRDRLGRPGSKRPAAEECP